jgi:hypothetical protein
MGINTCLLRHIKAMEAAKSSSAPPAATTDAAQLQFDDDMIMIGNTIDLYSRLVSNKLQMLEHGRTSKFLGQPSYVHMLEKEAIESLGELKRWLFIEQTRKEKRDEELKKQKQNAVSP